VEIKVRECDHHVTGRSSSCEGKKNDKYGYYPAFVEDDGTRTR